MINTVNVLESGEALQLAVRPDGNRVYVSATTRGDDFGVDSIKVIDTANDTVVATIPLANVAGMAFNSSGSRLYVVHRPATYVTNRNGVLQKQTGNDDFLQVIDTSTNSVIASVQVGPGFFNTASQVAVNPDGTRAYVTVPRFGAVYVVDTTRNAVISTIQTGGRPFGVTISPDGSRAFITDSALRSEGGSGSVWVVNTNTNAVTTTIPVMDSPRYLAASPDGTRVYVTGTGASPSVAHPGFAVINVADNSVSYLPGYGDGTLFEDFRKVKGPRSLAVTADGRRAYVLNSEFLNLTYNVAVINLVK